MPHQRSSMCIHLAESCLYEEKRASVEAYLTDVYKQMRRSSERRDDV